jgi:hypothetical protein
MDSIEADNSPATPEDNSFEWENSQPSNDSHDYENHHPGLIILARIINRYLRGNIVNGKD